MQTHTTSWMEPIITVYFPTVAILTGNLDVCLISLHTVHTCEYWPTSWFAHLMDLFLVRRAFSDSCWCRTPVRNSEHHDSIMINIMIVLLSYSVCIHTIMKDKEHPSMHEHRIMHEVPNIFPFSLSLNTSLLAPSFISYHLSYHFSNCLSYYLSYLSCVCRGCISC